MTVLAMSAAEITRFDTLMRLDRGEIRVADAMELLGLARRQVYRLLGRLREDGASGLVSRKCQSASKKDPLSACKRDPLRQAA
ncbi:helix-turn-helix domain-containing protein [Sphingomonas corticis]|uniref:helix-turn-helix domain-containing protein n=1 Tax=Sphingomonas corticis TaxID=2722791 RepID=UPI001EF0442B|nr:helix-turn-helix domain-containing protein [Sphingomonas corticis]